MAPFCNAVRQSRTYGATLVLSSPVDASRPSPSPYLARAAVLSVASGTEFNEGRWQVTAAYLVDLGGVAGRACTEPSRCVGLWEHL